MGNAAQRLAATRLPGAGALLALALLGSGCMAADAGTQGNNNNSNQNNPDGSVQCQYSIDVSPFTPKVGEAVELTAVSYGPCRPNPTGAYQWSVTGPDLSVVAVTTRQEGRIAELVPTQAGAYFVELTVNDLGSSAPYYVPRSVSVVDPAGMQQTYLLRLTPPLESGAPRQQRVLLVTGGTPISDRVLTLDEGVMVQNQLRGPDGPLAGYLRFVESGYALYREIHVPASGQFGMAVLPSSLYDVVVVPDGAEPAPLRLEAQTVSALLSSATFLLDSGVAVVGYIEDDQGAGVGHAQAVLRSGDLSSSVGESDAFDGRFVVWARPGAQGLELAPREGQALPRVRLPDTAGVVLPAGGGLGLRLRYHPVDTAALSLTVTAGAAPVVGARVTLEATDLGEVATLTVTQDGTTLATLPVQGSFRVSGVTDGAGVLTGIALPVGRYRVVIEAPADAPAGYATTVVEDLQVASGPASEALSLTAPAALEGVLLDDLLEPVEGVRVVAITGIGVGSAEETFTDADGYFTLDAVRGARYSVILMPPPARQLARRVEGPLTVGFGDVTALEGPGPGGALVLAPGLRVDGRVVYQANVQAGVLVQAIPSGAPGDPVLAEAVTDLAGEFSMVVPDPGDAP